MERSGAGGVATLLEAHRANGCAVQSGNPTSAAGGTSPRSFHELKSRRVYRSAIGYIVAASAAVQLAGTVLPIFHAPDWILQVSVVALALGFPVILVLAWVFEVEGGSIRRTRTVGGSRSLANRRRITVLAALGLLIAGAGVAGYWWWHPWNRKVAGRGAQFYSSPPIGSLEPKRR